MLKPPPSEKEDDEVQVTDAGLPKPPEPPRGTYTNAFAGPWADQFSALQARATAPIPSPIDISLFRHNAIPPHDPDAVYSSDPRPSEFVDDISLTCARFRHRLEPELFALVVEQDPELSRADGAIRCRVSAENLPEPVEYVLPIVVSRERGDISAEVEKFRPRPSLFGRLWRRTSRSKSTE